MEKKKQKIVILGAGYCGIRVAKKLATMTIRDNYELYIIDHLSKHVYLSDLYEIATAYFPHRSKKSINVMGDILSFPFHKLFAETGVHFLQQRVTKINPEKNQVQFESHPVLNYDYLVITLGSETNLFGLQPCQHLYPLKTLGESLELNSDLDHYFQTTHLEKQKKVSIVIGGGGFTGVEIACELPGFLNKLSKKYKFNLKKVRLTVIQGGATLVGLGDKVSNIVIRRFKKLNIHFMLKTVVKSFDGKVITTENKKNNKISTIPADFLIWTAGIKPNHILQNSFNDLSQRGEIIASATMQSINYPNIFVGGDNAQIINPKNQKPLPKLGQLAVQQGELIAKNILRKEEGKKLKKYRPLFKGFIITCGGRSAIYSGKIVFCGFIPWLMRKLIDLYYYASILSIRTALRKWWRMEEVITKND